jgi:hypothetical protein
MIRCRIVRRSGIKKTVRRWKKKHPARIHAGGVEAYTLQVQTAVKYRNVGPLLLNLLYDTDKSSVNAGIPECQKKVIPASAFLPAFNFVSPASGSVRYLWSQINPQFPVMLNSPSDPYVFGPPDPSLFVRIRILPSSSKNSKKNLISTVL